jgi:hypothetical protein
MASARVGDRALPLPWAVASRDSVGERLFGSRVATNPGFLHEIED